jgi:adenylate cyclase class IV
MVDRRFDQDGFLLLRDEVLRLREFHGDGAAVRYRLSWKGPTGVTAEGYKTRTELEYELVPLTAPPIELLERLGYREIQRIERFVEYYRLGEAEVRLEWYPRMDVLIEVEGAPDGIEAALRTLGLPRESWLPDPLPLFAARYADRTGMTPALNREELGDGAPSWEGR